MHNYAKIVHNLNSLLKKETPDKFDDLSKEQEEAFQALKERLVSPPILWLPVKGR